MIRVLPPQQPEVVVVSTDSSRFIPEIWSKALAAKFYPKSIIDLHVTTVGVGGSQHKQHKSTPGGS